VTGANRLANARAELAAARDAERVAEAALELGIVRDALSRTYYAAFHAARALLLLEGIEPRTHAGVQRMLGEHCVRTGRIAPALATTFAELQAFRQAADYAVSIDVDLDSARAQLSAAREFVTAAAAQVELAGEHPAR
jgi:uncharacterized protein